MTSRSKAENELKGNLRNSSGIIMFSSQVLANLLWADPLSTFHYRTATCPPSCHIKIHPHHRNEHHRQEIEKFQFFPFPPPVHQNPTRQDTVKLNRSIKKKKKTPAKPEKERAPTATVLLVYPREEVRLADSYQPHPFDVICRNDREWVAHSGNYHFLHQIELRVDRYAAARNRNEKTTILRDILHAIRIRGGTFIRPRDKVISSKDTRCQDGIHEKDNEGDKDNDNDNDTTKTNVIYFDIGSKKASDKVGHAMRLALSRRNEYFYFGRV